jgi:DNA-binding NarL/FixJ family response regulator
VLEPLVRGITNKEMYRELGMGFGTVKVRIAAFFQGLRVPNRAGAQNVRAQYL